jgi:hypothetical protein
MKCKKHGKFPFLGKCPKCKRKVEDVPPSRIRLRTDPQIDEDITTPFVIAGVMTGRYLSDHSDVSVKEESFEGFEGGSSGGGGAERTWDAPSSDNGGE